MSVGVTTGGANGTTAGAGVFATIGAGGGGRVGGATQAPSVSVDSVTEAARKPAHRITCLRPENCPYAGADRQTV